MSLEAPEVADSLLRRGWYQPSPLSDVWALGLLMLDTLGGHKPSTHVSLFSDPLYEQQLGGGRKWSACPAIRQYYSYLQSLLPSHGQAHYCQQVSTPACCAALHALISHRTHPSSLQC